MDWWRQYRGPVVKLLDGSQLDSGRWTDFVRSQNGGDMARRSKDPEHGPEAQVAGFIAKFSPEHEVLIAEVRRELRARFPTAVELVYDNYNFFVIGYSPTVRPSDAIVSLTANANGVGLCFIHGARLADPDRILRGSGSQTRSIRVPSPETLRDPSVSALMAAAEANARVPFSDDRAEVIIRSVSPKQRPRRK